MKVITLQPTNERVAVKTESKVIDTLLARNCDVAMACGGQGICATCHVYVKEGHDALTPMTKREKRTLSLLTGRDPGSRLACQARVIGDGVIVELPEGMYIESANALESLVGRLATVPILPPRDGRVLIPANKIITRSRILQLENEDLNVKNLHHNSLEL